MNIIEIENLCFSYNRIPVLHNLNLKVEKGDFLAIIGANGTGKSTLIKLILGQLFPQKGNINILGKPTSAFKRWNIIGYVPQITFNSGVNFPATVEEIVMMNLYSKVGFMRPFRKNHRDLVHNTLELVGVLELRKKQFANLSGGQQQRVMIAKALVNNPEIIILDEPTTGIDRASEDSLFELLQHLNSHHQITIIMITHDYNRIENLTTKTLTLNPVKQGEA